MGRTTHTTGKASFIADHSSVARSDGRQIDWANVNASFIPAGGTKKVLPAGTCVGELLGAGKVSPRVVTTNPAAGFLETDAIEGDSSAALSGYSVLKGGMLYEALLPDSSGSPRVLAGAIKTELKAAEDVLGFAFVKYEDVR